MSSLRQVCSLASISRVMKMLVAMLTNRHTTTISLPPIIIVILDLSDNMVRESRKFRLVSDTLQFLLGYPSHLEASEFREAGAQHLMDDLDLLGLVGALLADSDLRDGLPDLELELFDLLLEHLRLVYQVLV